MSLRIGVNLQIRHLEKQDDLICFLLDKLVKNIIEI